MEYGDEATHPLHLEAISYGSAELAVAMGVDAGRASLLVNAAWPATSTRGGT